MSKTAICNLIAALHYKQGDYHYLMTAQNTLGENGYEYAVFYEDILAQFWHGTPELLNDTQRKTLDIILTKEATPEVLILTPAKVASWCEIIRSDYNRRYAEGVFQFASANLITSNPDEVINTTIIELINLQSKGSSIVIGEDLARETIAEVEIIEQGRSHELRIPFYLEPIQSRIAGLKRSAFTLIAALPSHGKTALCETAIFSDAQLIKAQNLNACNVLIQCEQTRNDVIKYQAGRMSGLSTTDLIHRRFTELDYKRFKHEIGVASNLPVLINDKRSLGLANIRMTMEMARAMYGGIRILMIDTLERVTPSNNAKSADKEHKALVAGIEQLCKEYHCAGLVLHHLNRDTLKMTDPHKINESHIRWGGEDEAWTILAPVIPYRLMEQLDDNAKSRYGFNDSNMPPSEQESIGTIILIKDKDNPGRQIIKHHEVKFNGALHTWT